MRKLFTFLAIGFITQSALAQSPEKMSYQAVIRDASSQLVTNQSVAMKISVLRGSNTGVEVYSEIQNPVTNVNGLVTVEIGTGATSDDFSTIDWANGSFYIKTEIDIDNNSSYDVVSVSQLLSVPYALYAKKADTVENVEMDGNSSVFDGWDKSASDDFSGDYNDLSDLPLTISTEQADAITSNKAHTAVVTGNPHAVTKAQVGLGNVDNTSDANKPVSTATQTALDAKADANNVLTLDNTTAFTPDADYEPATKAYVDAHASSGMNVSGTEGDVMYHDANNWVAKNLNVTATTSNTGGNQSFNNMQPYTALNYCIALQGLYPSRSMDPFIGQIQLFGFNFAPRGWALCSGQLISISQNTALFSLLGTYYGGDGSTTFGLPDLRGRVAIGQGSGAGLPNYSLGAKGGSPTTTLNILNLPSHNHVVNISVSYE